MKNEEIYRLLDERDKKFDAQTESINKTLRYGLKGMRQYIDAGFETINEHEKIRNGRIQSNEKKIECVEGETTFWRWAHRNRKFSIPAAIVLLVGLIALVLWVGPVGITEFMFNKI